MPHDETVAAQHLEEWRNVMKEETDSIIHILPTIAYTVDGTITEKSKQSMKTLDEAVNS